MCDLNWSTGWGGGLLSSMQTCEDNESLQGMRWELPPLISKPWAIRRWGSCQTPGARPVGLSYTIWVCSGLADSLPAWRGQLDPDSLWPCRKSKWSSLQCSPGNALHVECLPAELFSCCAPITSTVRQGGKSKPESSVQIQFLFWCS